MLLIVLKPSNVTTSESPTQTHEKTAKILVKNYVFQPFFNFLTYYSARKYKQPLEINTEIKCCLYFRTKWYSFGGLVGLGFYDIRQFQCCFYIFYVPKELEKRKYPTKYQGIVQVP